MKGMDKMDNCCCVESCGSGLPGVARGNDFKVTARVSLYDEGTGKLSPLDLTTAEGVEMAVIGRFSRTEGADVRVDGSRVTASFPWSLPCGTYGVEILFRDAAGRGRVYDRAVFEVVDSVSDVTSAATDGDRQVSVDISVRTVYIGKGTDVSDYPSLTGKPKVNGVELIGNKTAEELGLATAEDIPDTSGLVKSEDLSKVATSGDYSDLSNKPAIPTAVTEQTVEGWGFTKNAGDYSKPTGGIPKSDLASAVQTSLGKADTALQSESDPTVPDWAKQSTKPTYTAAEVGALPSTTKIPSKTSDLTNDSGFLTEHQQLKTIDGETIVGDGNLSTAYDISTLYQRVKNVQYGGDECYTGITTDEYNQVLNNAKLGKNIFAIYDNKVVTFTTQTETDSNGKEYIYLINNTFGSLEYAQVTNEHIAIEQGYHNRFKVEKVIRGSTDETINLNPDYDYVFYYIDSDAFDGLSSLTININSAENEHRGVCEWAIQFDVPSDMTTLPTINWDSTLLWANGEVMSIEAGYTYEFDIIKTPYTASIVGQKFNTVSE